MARQNATQRGYGSRWRKARKVFLSQNPLCRYCEQLGRTSAATVVDHIVPHKGDELLFWDVSNWQPLCGSCHNGAKQAQEKTGKLKGCDVSGIPVDGSHHWNS